MYYSLTYNITAHVNSARTNVYMYNCTHKYAKIQRSSHKQCIRKLNGYMFILGNVVNEKRSLEKSLSSLSRRVIHLASSANFSYLCRRI